MRLPYPVEYYEGLLKKLYGIIYIITPVTEWHGLRTNVNIYCSVHKTIRTVYLKKVFNGTKSTRPCRKCYLDSIAPTNTRDNNNSQ